ncbi:MAG: TolC family protein, partial [Desulfomonilia bacterium]|nr:TolC family protein [Desulfomonilia bacterium]
YESVVLSALEDVESALVAYVQEQIRKESLDTALHSAREAADCARYSYDAGLIDFDALLNAQRTLLTYESEHVQSSAAVIMNLVRLYKALGGGWTAMAPDDAPLISWQGDPHDGTNETR